MTNNRVHWPCLAVGLAPLGSTTYVSTHGVQDIGINTNFNIETIFELGQSSAYQRVETIPEIEITMEKVLDGYPLIYHLATRGFAANTLLGRSNQRCTLAMSIFGDVQDSASGVPVSQVTASGLYWSSLSYTFPVDGRATESITLVGNDLEWITSAYTYSGSLFDNTDSPLAEASGWGGVQQRQEFVWTTNTITLDANNQVAAEDASILPPDIDGVSTSGTNFPNADNVTPAHVQTITVSVDAGREDINELGHKKPYFRYLTLPVSVNSEIEVLTTRGHHVNAVGDANNTVNRSIRIKVQEGTFINLGTKNRLNSVTFGGASAGGGNATCTYSYSNDNDFIITHPQDPT